MRSPRNCAVERERHPQLPPGADERVWGYGVMGQPFASGHVLGLRRWTASSVGDQFTSIWHRDPAGTWHFYESAQPLFACSRWFGHGVRESTVVDIDLTWDAPNVLRVESRGLVDWTVTLGSSPMTHVMNGVSSVLPYRAWRSAAMLRAMGAVASATLGVGRVGLTGLTANGAAVRRQPAAHLARRRLPCPDRRPGRRASGPAGRAGASRRLLGPPAGDLRHGARLRRGMTAPGVA